MKRNISNTERIIRAMASIAFIALNISGIIGSPENILVWVIAGILLLTAVAGNCPVYTLFGINTHSRKKEFKQYH